jgi:hypothetical protein
MMNEALVDDEFSTIRLLMGSLRPHFSRNSPPSERSVARGATYVLCGRRGGFEPSGRAKRRSRGSHSLGPHRPTRRVLTYHTRPTEGSFGDSAPAAVSLARPRSAIDRARPLPRVPTRRDTCRLYARHSATAGRRQDTAPRLPVRHRPTFTHA